MTDREMLYQQFGPKLVEAVVFIVKDEINLLRLQVGLPERTNQQLLDAIDNKLQTSLDYEWMKQTS